MQSAGRTVLFALVAVVSIAIPARAEIVEEIVALIDGDILTKSEYETEEQAIVQEIYRRYTGPELDQAVQSARDGILMDLIDRKILVRRAGRMFDSERMADAFYEMFREQQQIENEEEFLAEMGMTMEGLKKRLISVFAPDEVVRFEVSSRISVSDREVDAYYAEHPDEFYFDDEAELREIVLKAGTEDERAERRAEAGQLHARLSAENFAQIATESSESGTQSLGGHLGTVKKGDLSEVLEQAAFGLTAGTWSDVLEMPYGFHILYADRVRIGQLKSLEDVRDELRIRLEDDLFSAKLNEFMTKARGESEWCVKGKFVAGLPAKHEGKVCKEM